MRWIDNTFSMSKANGKHCLDDSFTVQLSDTMEWVDLAHREVGILLSLDTSCNQEPVQWFSLWTPCHQMGTLRNASLRPHPDHLQKVRRVGPATQVLAGLLGLLGSELEDHALVSCHVEREIQLTNHWVLSVLLIFVRGVCLPGLS